MSTERKFVFKYSLPQPAGGPLVELSFEEAERLLHKNLREAATDRRDALWELARFYSSFKQHEKALDYLRQIIALQPDTEQKAHCVLAMGQTMEQVGDYEAAVRFYREAFAHEPVNTGVWYFINNNLGFSLNALGRFDEGEQFCRAAITIDRLRPNAFKNLGLALQGQRRFQEAARCYVQATQADASDSRSLELLEKLHAQHPELELSDELGCCRHAVHMAGEKWKASQPVIHRGWRKRLILIRQGVINWLKQTKN